jgi:hypothetical protein
LVDAPRGVPHGRRDNPLCIGQGRGRVLRRPDQSASVHTNKISSGPPARLTSPGSARRGVRRLMNQCPSHCALFSFTEMTHRQPRHSDRHRIDRTAESLHRVFRLQPKGLPRTATVAIHLLRTSSHRCSTVVLRPSGHLLWAARSGPARGKRGQGITRSGAAPVLNYELGINTGHAFPNTQHLPASAPT